MLPTKFWAEMSWRDFAAADMSKVVAVLPVAAIEQHGPHLPVGVDAFINEGYLARAVARIPADLPVLFLPLQAVGKSNEHIEFPGTLTLRSETLARAWTEIGESVARTGCRKLIFINSHGGNVAGHRHRRARIAGAPAHARGQRVLAAPRLSRGSLLRARARARHPWRRRRDLADARLPAGDGAHGRGARLRQRGDGDGARIQAFARDPADRLRLDGERLERDRRGRRRRRAPPRRRAKPAPSTARTRSSSCCATSPLSTSPGSARARSAENGRARLRLRARAFRARLCARRGRRRGRPGAARRAGRRRRGDSRSRRSCPKESTIRRR